MFFFPGAQRVEIDLRPVEGKRVEQSDWDQIQVKIGLENLRLESSRQTLQGRTLTFARSSRITDLSRIEIAFIALTDAKRSARGSTFMLKRVRWRE